MSRSERALLCVGCRHGQDPHGPEDWRHATRTRSEDRQWTG